MDPTVITQSIPKLIPLIRARRAEIEQARSLPRTLESEMRKAGIFSLGLPRTIGGAEAPLPDLMRTVESISTADGSAGWCAMVGIINNTVAGYLSEAGAREVFADVSAPSAGIAAPIGAAVRTDGGVRVNGRWPFASGITHCEWVWAGCVVMENGQPRMTPNGPEIIHVCLPVREVTIHDTWQVSGLCGTGSQDFSAQDVLVPERRIFALLDPSGHRPEPLYQMPPLHLFVFHVACVSLGIARGALDEFSEFAQTKVPSLYTDVLADKPVAQVELARAEVALGGARAFLYEAAADIWETVCAGRVPAPRQLALGRAAATGVAETAVTVTQTAARLAGGTSIYTTHPLQRHVRDAEALSHHFTVAPHTWEEAGRCLFGRTPVAPVF